MATAAPRIDWAPLVAVRERRRDAARDELQREQQAGQRCRHEVQQAHAAWQAQLAARDRHAQVLRQELCGGAARVEDLRQGGAWDGTLARRILGRAQAVVLARERLAAQEHKVATQRGVLLKAEAELDQARDMQERDRRSRRRDAERRTEDALDEGGVQAWQRRLQAGAA